MTPALFSMIRFEHVALLLMRSGLGALVSFHGHPLFTGGPPAWAELGKATAAIGIPFHPTVFGFLAALSLFFGGMFVVLGLFSRIWCLLIGVTLAVATVSQIRGPDGFEASTHALALTIVFLGLFSLGPGRYSLDEKFFG